MQTGCTDQVFQLSNAWKDTFKTRSRHVQDTFKTRLKKQNKKTGRRHHRLVSVYLLTYLALAFPRVSAH